MEEQNVFLLRRSACRCLSENVFCFFYMKGSIVVKITQEKQVNAKSVSVSFSGAPLGTLNLSWKPEQLPR